MIHLGDITKIDGAKIPPVDVITGGSPCQDLSVAGGRAGLAGERSGLFMEMIRVIKEMRNATANSIRHLPRFLLWENVAGALSSNGGEDFRAVLEETARIADPSANVPRPDGKWSNCGSILGNGYSISWNLHDAQWWGVPQRRKRLCMVCDFDGLTAPEILFSPQLRGEAERTRAEQADRHPRNESRPEVPALGEGVPRHPAESGEAGEGTPEGTERGVGATSYTLKIRGGVDIDSHGKRAGKGALVQTEMAGTLAASQDQTLIVFGISPYASNAMMSDNPHSGIYQTDTARTLDHQGGSPACNQGGTAIVQILDARGNGGGAVSPTLTGDHQDRITDYTAIILEKRDEVL